MAARAMWKGTLRLGKAEVPVKLFSAIEGSQELHFRLLHAPDQTPVQGRMVHPVTGKPVTREETKRGYVTDSGEVVVLEPKELATLEPEPSRDIEVLRVVPSAAVDPAWYDRPYYLGPEGDAADYWALAAALEKKEMEGIVRWVMRKKEYVGSLRVEGGYPMLVTLRRAGEVVHASELPRPAGRDLAEKELEMAERLLKGLKGEFDAEEWKDEHRERVLELVEAKASGKTVPIARAKAKKSEGDLTKALEKSLAALKRSA
jgi:DNA end-binding protein Ku